jgi:hypothetical protein
VNPYRDPCVLIVKGAQMREPDIQRYFAYADAVGRAHGHVVTATSYEAAAAAYAEIHAPPVDGDDDLRVFVQGEDGLEHCFTLDLDDGANPEPCD